MSAKDIIVDRDSDNDVLYVIKEDVDKATTINISATADIVMRLDRKTRKVVGFTIESFSKVMPDIAHLEDYNLMEIFDGIIEFLEASNLVKT